MSCECQQRLREAQHWHDVAIEVRIICERIQKERDEARKVAEDLFELQLNMCSACIGHPFASQCTCKRTLPWRKEEE